MTTCIAAKSVAQMKLKLCILDQNQSLAFREQTERSQKLCGLLGGDQWRSLRNKHLFLFCPTSDGQWSCPTFWPKAEYLNKWNLVFVSPGGSFSSEVSSKLSLDQPFEVCWNNTNGLIAMKFAVWLWKLLVTPLPFPPVASSGPSFEKVVIVVPPWVSFIPTLRPKSPFVRVS